MLDIEGVRGGSIKHPAPAKPYGTGQKVLLKPRFYMYKLRPLDGLPSRMRCARGERNGSSLVYSIRILDTKSSGLLALANGRYTSKRRNWILQKPLPTITFLFGVDAKIAKLPNVVKRDEQPVNYYNLVIHTSVSSLPLAKRFPMRKNDDRQEDDDWRRIMSSGLSVGGMDSAVPSLGGDAIKHAEDAIDYGEEDELADDEDLPEEEEPSGHNVIDGGQDNLEALMAQGRNPFDEQGSSHQLLRHNLDSHTMGYDQQVPDLEERVGSEYAAALMNFDDDWMGGESMRPPKNMTPVTGFHTDDVYSRGGSHTMDIDNFGMQSDLDILPPTDTDFEKPHEGLTEEEAQRTKADDAENEARLLKLYYPDFEPNGVLKVNSIFAPRSAYFVSSRPKVVRPLVPTRVNLEVETDQRLRFKARLSKERTDAKVSKTINIYPTTVALITSVNAADDGELKEQQVANEMIERDLLIATADWDHMFRDTDSVSPPPQLDSDSDSDASKHSTHGKLTTTKATKPAKKFNFFSAGIYDSDDEEGFFEGTFNNMKRKPVLDMNDSRMLFTSSAPSNALIPAVSNQRAFAQIPTTSRNFQLRYNISNDRAYDLLKENYQSKIRSIVGNLNIDHSMVALRLQSPHYKVKLSKAQMRSYHRPTFVVRPNTTIHFTKIKQRKRKRDKGKSIQQLLSKTTDLTLGDSAQFFLLEYSEEFPLMLSNFGMGSKIINYYRKASPEDQSRPKLPTGETNVLGTQDRSAFWNFGFVEGGKIVPTLYNKMIRAPVFKHKPESTDFLLIRSTGGGKGQRYFMRSIPHMFTVGQTFPVTTVPGPHSRKVTTASKNRLKMVVFRVLNKSNHHRILVRDISAHFPGQNEMQNRQRLKEFMEFQRHGDDQGFWKIKGGEALPNEDVIRGMISPEDISLLEAMQVGQQHLEDAGYSKTVEEVEEEGGSIEEQLAPWNITRNFMNATQGKAMLQLHGEGDPSGCGEGFSFLRTSMKGGFKAMGESVNEKLDKSKFGGHSYNVALQQKAYDEEIGRIWCSQAKSLSSTNRDDLGWDEAESKRDGVQETENSTSIARTPGGDDGMSLFSQNSVTQGQNKVLRITRFVRDENGTVQRKVEVITEPNVIRAYVKRRQEIEDSSIAYVYMIHLNLFQKALTNFLVSTKLHRLTMRKKISVIARGWKTHLQSYSVIKTVEWLEGLSKLAWSCQNQRYRLEIRKVKELVKENLLPENVQHAEQSAIFELSKFPP